MRKLLALLAALVLAACAPAQKQAEYTLTYASPYPPGHPFSRADIAWMKHLEQASGGRIGFRTFWSGSLISSDMSMEEIRHGLVDVGLITPIYARGGAHLLRAQSGFYGGIASIRDQVAVYDCLDARFPEIGQELEGLHVLAAQGGLFPGVLTRNKPVRTLADLKGLRLRAQSDAIDVLRALGADPVNMPMGEVYSALAKGVIDGVVAPADTIKSLHFAEVAHHFTQLRFSRGAYPARAMSDAAWRRLPPDLQGLVGNSRKFWEDVLNTEILASEKAGVDFAAAHKVEMIPFPAAEQHKLDQLYNRYALDQARALGEVGINGEPVFRAAQALIAAGPIACPAPNSGVKP
ncbi:TRAP transporter substrate-binding protein DctP [Novosphingobium flavum]|uniref:TRAP transporter substrate-binding protein DctP n=1 Tax=Novosphingobium flavum TaxID=1778672 RepID=A0A7X1FR36_9SPHN|nr:TRAP transporter substrate-binding protein DctP [Novosphingobium flavum]MBC2665421.1 TRAP transporter substrate-binding protein DctP [Novosphingobium flavum]